MYEKRTGKEITRYETTRREQIRKNG
jgi:hypothetical protein